MGNDISTSELFWYVIELEKFESSTTEEKVIEKAMEAGFITKDNLAENLSNLVWIKKVTKHAEDAFNLEEVAEGRPLEVSIANFKQLKNRRDKQVSDILELLAKHVIHAAPGYKS
ncbi:hypothetical protein [Aliivibrio sp. 1S128]|uniref:hypothetical protein n=1 Tax=Aliivibrio sp. 1S128 TaxID=1840085 RepID=UPI00080DFF34|nr:hypothetical protein [Aliivibrio sp. 1S128]OCH11481.1 hypothetical protein A6E03_04225 [Aliivibrio sp. 1S128]